MVEAALLATILALPLPPPQYDHAPQNAYVWHQPLVGVDHHCRWRSDRRTPGLIVGCAYRERGLRLCKIIVPHPSEVGQRAYRRIVKHERAHCNGWSGDHPH